jgi:hypothetical protein
MSLIPAPPGVSRSNLRVISGNSTGIPLPGSARALPSKWAALDAEATALAAGTVLAPAQASAPSPLPSALPGPRYAASPAAAPTPVPAAAPTPAPAAAPAPAPAALPGARYGGEAPPEMAQGLRALRSRISSSRAPPPPQRAASPLSSGASYFAVSPAGQQQQQQQRARAPRAASTNSTVSSCAGSSAAEDSPLEGGGGGDGGGGWRALQDEGAPAPARGAPRPALASPEGLSCSFRAPRLGWAPSYLAASEGFASPAPSDASSLLHEGGWGALSPDLEEALRSPLRSPLRGSGGGGGGSAQGTPGGASARRAWRHAMSPDAPAQIARALFGGKEAPAGGDAPGVAAGAAAEAEAAAAPAAAAAAAPAPPTPAAAPPGGGTGEAGGELDDLDSLLREVGAPGAAPPARPPSPPSAAAPRAPPAAAACAPLAARAPGRVGAALPPASLPAGRHLALRLLGAHGECNRQGLTALSVLALDERSGVVAPLALPPGAARVCVDGVEAPGAGGALLRGEGWAAAWPEWAEPPRCVVVFIDLGARRAVAGVRLLNAGEGAPAVGGGDPEAALAGARAMLLRLDGAPLPAAGGPFAPAAALRRATGAGGAPGAAAAWQHLDFEGASVVPWAASAGAEAAALAPPAPPLPAGNAAAAHANARALLRQAYEPPLAAPAPLVQLLRFHFSAAEDAPALSLRAVALYSDAGARIPVAPWQVGVAGGEGGRAHFGGAAAAALAAFCPADAAAARARSGSALPPECARRADDPALYSAPGAPPPPPQAAAAGPPPPAGAPWGGAGARAGVLWVALDAPVALGAVRFFAPPAPRGGGAGARCDALEAVIFADGWPLSAAALRPRVTPNLSSGCATLGLCDAPAALGGDAAAGIVGDAAEQRDIGLFNTNSGGGR